MLTMGQAARLTGLGKSTISRAIKNGVLSATRTATGSYEIDGAELARVWPAETAAGTSADAGRVVQDATPAALPRNEFEELVTLRAMQRVAEERLAELKEQLRDAVAQRDRWQDAFENTQRALPKPVEKPMTWWRWLRSTG